MPQSHFFSKPHNQLLATAAMALLVLALGAYAYLTFKQADQWNSGPTTISVVGTGEVFAKPDIAQFSFTVRGEGVDAATAQEKSGTIINAVTESLKKSGIEDKDIKTDGYNMSPKYKYEQKPCIFGQACPPGEQIADGFEVMQTVTVKVRKIDTAGTLLVEVGKLGATDLSSLSFTVDDTDALTADARALAIKDAQEQAKKIASDLGMSLGKMTGYYEEVPGGMPYMSAAPMMDSAMGGAKSFERVNVPTGENKTTSKVNLTYILK